MVVYISEQYLKDRSNLSNNIDIALLKHNIIKAQDIFISEFIGETIDTQLKDKLELNPDGSTLTDLEKDLLGLIKKALVEYASHMSYVDILFRFSNKSAVIPNSDNSTALSLDDLKYVRDIAKNDGEFYLFKIEKFLIKNKDIFSSFLECNCNSNSKGSFKFGIYYENKFRDSNLFRNNDGYDYN